MVKPRTGSSRRAPAAASAREVAALRRRLKAAEALAEARETERLRLLSELHVYQEESRAHTDQLLASHAALEESRDRYASLYDSAPVGYLTLDADGVVREANLTTAHMLGVRRERLLRTPLLTLVAPEDRQPFLKHLLGIGSGVREVELQVVRPADESRLPVLLRTWSSPGRQDAAGGSPFEYRSVLLDLSERRRAREREKVYLDRLQSLSTALTLAEERERRRIAVELHDNISQSLVLLKMKLAQLRHSAAGEARLHKMASDALGLLDPLIQSSRTLTFELSPPVLYELGFEAALEWLAESIARRHKLDVKVTPDGRPAPQQGDGAVPHDIAVLVLQAVRELLMNVVKHAGARHAEVRSRVTEGGHLVISVADDGRGFDPDRLVARADEDEGGFGLFSIRTRLQYLGGAMDIETQKGRGSRLTLTVPLRRSEVPPPAAADSGKVQTVPGLGGNARQAGDRMAPASAAADRDGPSELSRRGTPLTPGRSGGANGVDDDENSAGRRPPHREARAAKPARNPTGPASGRRGGRRP